MDFGFICLIYLVGCALLFVELFVPGGFVGVIGFVIMSSGIVFAFQHHPPLYGTSLVVVTLVVVPVMTIWTLKKITLTEAQGLEDGFTSADESLEQLVGKEGKTLTSLRPSGTAIIENKRYDVTSETVMLDENTPIKVSKVEGNRIVVKAVNPSN